MSISLAEIFDALVEDETVSNQYADFVLGYISKGSCLDLACGTGTISEKLKNHFKITGLDIDPDMLKQYMKRNPECETILGSMSDLRLLGSYDSIILFGDSLNYLLGLDEVKQVISEALHHLNDKGFFFFDMHTENRHQEFIQEYLEEGIVLGHPFQWTILSLPDLVINHHFAFYDEVGHAQTLSFNQKVYPYEDMVELLESLNCKFDVYSDFELGHIKDKEKYLFVLRKETS
ncbi:MAG: methyltransferase [Erysipelotrichaceae bacterium]|nr:MAG: hypothetical protein FD179_641 [Erysipelotrichaceae bacterium]TXT17501.1 MAG: methyltransferase [Erysipelotrichaceae bacterium]